MNSIDIVKKIQEVLNCDIKVAESIKRRCEGVGISDVQIIEKQLDSAYIVVKMSVEDGKDYYLFLDRGFFLYKIREGAIDGKCMFRVIE